MERSGFTEANAHETTAYCQQGKSVCLLSSFGCDPGFIELTSFYSLVLLLCFHVSAC